MASDRTTILYTAAHSGFNLDRVPLGGGAAVCSRLVGEWKKNRPFNLRLLGPSLLGSRSPKNKDLVRFSEREYARFCVEFERAATAEILRHPPDETVVLSNDVSEGPAFRLLAERGYRLFTLYHVDVVDYFAAVYLRRWIRPETATAAYAWLERSPLRRFLPALSGLIFKKQRDSLAYSRGVIVPSEGMKHTLLRCYSTVSPTKSLSENPLSPTWERVGVRGTSSIGRYPSSPPSPTRGEGVVAIDSKIHVIPWGIWEETFEEAALHEKADELRWRYRIPPGAPVLLTLSRISPEKGQDRLLKALKRWERKPDFPREGIWVLICGEAAYMRGAGFRKKLEKLARGLRKTRVIFPGYVSGLLKQAFFRLATLYVFPSRHESYGLTLLEALQAGLPALACHHYGAEELLRPEFGRLLPPAEETEVPGLLEAALRRLLPDPERLKTMGLQAKTFAQQQKFSDAAARLAQLILL